MPSDARTWVKSLAWRPVDTMAPPKRCHWGRGACEKTAAFELNRTIGGGKPRWWGYCREHVEAYGNRIVGLEVQIAVAPDSPAAKRGWTQ